MSIMNEWTRLVARGILGWGGGGHNYFGTCAEDAFLANPLDNVEITDIVHCVL